MLILINLITIINYPPAINIKYPMQKSPDADLKAVSHKFLEVLKELQASKEWQQVDDKPVHIQRMERGDRAVARAEIVMNLPIETLTKYFDDPAFMKKVSDRVANFDVLYKVENLTVIHVQMKGFAMVSDRELVAVYTFHREGNKIYFGNRSCEFACAAYPDTVRAFAHCGGYILEKIGENATKVTNIVDLDMNGSIPNFVKNKLAMIRASVLAELEEKIKATFK